MPAVSFHDGCFVLFNSLLPTIAKRCSSFDILTAESDHRGDWMGDHDGADVWNAVIVDNALYSTGYEGRRRRWERMCDNGFLTVSRVLLQEFGCYSNILHLSVLHYIAKKLKFGVLLLFGCVRYSK